MDVNFNTNIMRKKQVSRLTGIVLVSLVLVGCSFLATTREDMEAVEAEMAEQPAHLGTYEEYTPGSGL
jgi:hypothetical protein